MFRTLRSHVAGQAVAEAYAAFKTRHPDYAAALFDEHFLRTRVTPLLSAPGGASTLTPDWLAEAWAAQFNSHVRNPTHLIVAATSAATDYIDLLLRALTPPIGSQLAAQASPAGD